MSLLRDGDPSTDLSKAGVVIGILNKFRSLMAKGDLLITYDPDSREYLVGEVAGDYEFRPDIIKDLPHTRSALWKSRISRDRLSAASRNTLGSTLALFQPGEDVQREIERLVKGEINEAVVSAPEDLGSDLDLIRQDVVERAHEFVKDRISKLTWDEMQELVAAILRAMGYKTRVSPPGSDKGKDIVASRDGLGLEPPRIKVEVKHRLKQQIGAPEVRSFIGGLRADDRGLYVSTGGFSTEAVYEAERATTPVTLLNLDEIAALLVQHYDRVDTDGRALVPMVRLFWPAS